ncbi:C40 family peptidase [Paenibacillus eucommiae]|uniref:Cell wall-associated NlpC family hydrolase n=1 Tax=Paenibacillus eucommiae TaxID=1355755 RepID=A0ABS4JA32_9BACL|nr:C40 family peptidase [Paenibacillus eucommiae]MBP1996692.1 cell wall-associated NlpC family hydrolase [Paenibacillus eucommiae]
MSSREKKMLKYAKSFVGMQFRRNPPSLEIDCSQFTQMVFAKVGVSLPRTSQDQAKQGVAVSFADLRLGDLVFYHIPERNAAKGSIGHVAIYAGKGKIVHCLPTSNFFLTDMNKPYWKTKYLFARRVL